MYYIYMLHFLWPRLGSLPLWSVLSLLMQLKPHPWLLHQLQWAIAQNNSIILGWQGIFWKRKEALLFLHGGPKSVGSWCWVAHISYKGQPSTLHSFLLTPLFTAIHFAIFFLSRVQEVTHLQHIGKIFLANVEKGSPASLQPHIVTSIGSLVICENLTHKQECHCAMTPGCIYDTIWHPMTPYDTINDTKMKEFAENIAKAGSDRSLWQLGHWNAELLHAVIWRICKLCSEFHVWYCISLIIGYS